jgi:hypothetical protein
MNNKNNNLSKNPAVFQMAIVLSAMMLATLAISSLVQTNAFAQSPIQTEINNDVNVDTDLDIITDEQDCIEASDQTTQNVGQNIDLQSSSDNENFPQVLTGVNTATNVAVTPDVDLTGQCNAADQTNQGIVQSQNLQPDTEASDAYTTSVNNARNIADDRNYSFDLPQQ